MTRWGIAPHHTRLESVGFMYRLLPFDEEGPSVRYVEMFRR